MNINITLGSGKAVHTARYFEGYASTPECGGNRAAEGYSETKQDVTCKKCLKLIAAREAAADRVAYYADLRDDQDMDMSQAAPVKAEVAATVGQTVRTDAGPVPGHAHLVDVTMLAWIPGTNRGTVTTAEEYDVEFGLTVWVYTQFSGSPARMVYRGDSRMDALTVHNDYIAAHEERLNHLATSVAGVRVAEPTASVTKSYKAPADTDPATDPATGLPVVRVGSYRYVVGPWQRNRFGNPDYVYYWLSGNSTGRRTTFRAYADAPVGSTARVIWDAQRALR